MPAALTPREWGAVVREARSQRGLTQAELASRIGASRYWVVAFERGKPGVELGLVLKAIKALGLRVELTSAGAQEAAEAAPHPAPRQDSPAVVLERLRALANPPAPKARIPKRTAVRARRGKQGKRA